MKSKLLKSLLQRSNSSGPVRAIDVLGVVVALSPPAIAYLVGAVFSCIAGSLTAEEDPRIAGFARFLPNPNAFFDPSVPALERVSWLLGVSSLVILLTAVLLYFYYRQIQSAAVEFECKLMEKLRSHGKNLARVRTLSAQKQALTDGLNYHLPRVRIALTRWWRTYPRHLVQLAACFILALLVEPLLALLAVVVAGLIQLVYRWLDRSGRTTLPVIRERASLQRDELVDLSLRGPLLESVHDEQSVEHRFLEQLLHYRRDAIRSLASSAWKTPVLILVGGMLVMLLVFVVAVQIVSGSSDFGIAGAITFCLCCVGCVVSFVRWQRAARELRTVESAAEELERFLAIPLEEVDVEELEQIERVERQAELDHVTVQDSRGRKLLENVSAVFTPNKLIGVIASQPLQAHALAELLLGFGRPVSGRMLLDDKVVTDLRPDSLAHCAHWVSPDGAIVPGTLKDNLTNGDRAKDVERLEAIIKETGVSEIMHLLPEGLSTIISPGDDRLSADAPFRIGLARAVLRSPSIVVVEEPKSKGYDAESEQQTLRAIQSLVHERGITVVLPERLNTLRHCDTVIMLHDHRVAGVGTHTTLLQENELYRHLNYLKFNPFRVL
ncbi:MAG: ABC transporter ATP-binding protein/permease [bacterium]|nr:ABC transporter ATP-binding protein/permease [bacterium]